MGKLKDAQGNPLLNDYIPNKHNGISDDIIRL